MRKTSMFASGVVEEGGVLEAEEAGVTTSSSAADMDIFRPPMMGGLHATA